MGCMMMLRREENSMEGGIKTEEEEEGKSIWTQIEANYIFVHFYNLLNTRGTCELSLVLPHDVNIFF